MQKIGVIGLGLNGLITTLAAHRAGCNVEAFETKIALESYSQDTRTSLISAQTINFFQEMGIYEKLKSFLSPIFHIYAFEENRDTVLSFDSSQPYGFVAPNNLLKETLFSEITRLQIEIHNENVTDTAEDGSFIKVHSSEKEKEYKLLLDCSGKSKILSRQNFPYEQEAIVFNIKHEEDHRNIAVESFTPGGVLAILPLLEKTESAVIWNIRENSSFYLRQLESPEFLKIFKEKAQRMKHIGEIMEIITPPRSYPLALSFSAPQNRGRTFLIGDSYNTIHPVAGQAFNMSVKDIKNLYHGLGEAIKLGLDIGSFTFLSAMARKNLKHHISMNLFTHFTIKIFTSRNGIVKTLRSIGVKGLEEMSFLKKIIARRASGL